ncbi:MULTISPECIES: ABC transporter substrate-binding protein [Burkholderiaceae]|jgi:branched-chain amino acid transport system substrate-binding protein|uniref:ABC branched chain amino acid family transporter, periplasmic ligand binding protein n=1 Tax=Paraburkholderia phytofirmans (strain DSM 17436 / LMG 22146 / PsJN) TaxID=398527 RepID=B2T028_PARPJ|nr:MULTISPECIES: ABC transporter substrate-binding protein [Burkholderiaceae]UTP22275.1 ABC transporter substrate-binding protein [Burkholderia sp. FXe9]HEF5874247.1 ABC transporter substrate-binding protein [Burkholderia cenocepacia]ACD14589.1 ABC branched chain amino acid family transporter, periplasmic ligand binding protein [Paraburkholderia phytofirmans PsJN]MBA9947230.1 branched-chain amino acid ABC transporter substrate-binding protein [Burkholderia cepacia]MBA9977408.1 branched-chain a
MNRRDFSRTVLLGAAASLAASTVPRLARAATPLKIGLLAPLSGPLTRVGQTNRNCAALAVDEINAAGGLLGRPLQLSVEDTQMSTAVTLEKARQLFMRDDVAMITGMVLPSEREAALQAARPARKLIVYPNFDEGRCDPQLLTTGLAASQRIEPLIAWLMRDGGRSVCAVVSDIGSNRKVLIPQLQAAVARHGGKFLDVYWLPFGTRDYGAVLQQVAGAGPQIVWHSIGDDPVTFVKQYRSFAMKPQLVTDIAHESLSIATTGASTGTIGVSSYFMSIDNPENQAFLTRYTARYAGARDPRLGRYAVVLPHGENTYAGIRLFAEAVKSAGSVDADRIRAALPAVSVALPRGKAGVSHDGGHVLCQTRIGQALADNSFAILESTGPVIPVCQG